MGGELGFNSRLNSGSAVPTVFQTAQHPRRSKRGMEDSIMGISQTD